GIGALTGLAFFAAELLGFSSAIAALLAVTAGIALTGALHEDGLADTVDGFGGGATRDDKLRIMRDSRQGAFGVIALLLSTGLRAAAWGRSGEPIHAGLALVAAHAASRGALPPLMRLMSPAQTDGLGAGAGRPSRAIAVTAAVLGAVIALALLGPGNGAGALALTAVALALAAWLAHRQIGGYTGDVLGAFQQIGEMVMLLAAAAR